LKTKLYAEDLLRKLLKKKEMKVLEVVWSEADPDQQIKLLLEGK